MRRFSTLLILSLIFFLNTPLTTLAEDTNLSLENYIHNPPKKFILDNGLIVILKEVPSSGLVSIDARVKAGSAYEGKLSGSGISHLVEHMIFKGTKKRRPSQIEREIRSLGGVINGATSHDYTIFTITIPKEHLTLALEVLSDSLFNANMNKAELNKERNVILKEIRLNRDDPMRYISRMLWSTVFETHPYRHPVIGYENLFVKITREDLLRFYKDMYVPNNMTLVLVGDIEINSALREVKKCFRHVERSVFEERALPQERPQASKRTLDIERELEMFYFALGYRSVDVHNPDMAALDVLSTILGGGESSRLNSDVYRKKNLVYSIGSWNYTPRDPGIFIISGVTEPKKIKPALGAIKEVINNIKRGGVNEEEIQRAKVMITSDYIYSLETLSDQARDLATNEVMTGDFEFTKKYLERIDSVTQDDIKRVAGFYLNDVSLSLVTLSPSSEKAAPKKKEKRIEKEVQKFTLPNGLRYLLMEDHSLPIVSMIAVCLGGLRAEVGDTAGISNFTSLMMLKGTASRSEEDISNLVEGMGASLGFFSGNNTLGIKLNLLSKDVDKGLELFEDIILNPSFPKDVFEREKATIMASIKATEDDIFNMGMKIFKETLFKVHPYRFQTIGTINSIKGLTNEDLKEFHNEYFIPYNMVIGFFGDFNSTKLREKIDEDFSKLKDGPMPRFTAIIEPTQTEIRQNIKTTQKEQSLVIMGLKGADLASKDRCTLQLISAALSGISGRLSARLRERLGLAYAIGSFSVPAVDPGYFVLYISTSYNNIERVKKELINQITLLNKKGLTPEELDSAKKELIGNYRIALQTNASLARHTALDELYGLGYDNYLNYDEIINSITNNDIVDVSKRYLKPDAFTLIIIEGLRPSEAVGPKGKRGGWI